MLDSGREVITLYVILFFAASAMAPSDKVKIAVVCSN
jgi:hypothetical protein